MSDLAEFLLARIAEEEAQIPPEYASEDWGGSGFNADPIMFEVTPRRWLAECEAKRRIVDEHRGEAEDVSWSETAVYCRRCCYDGGLDRDVYPCPTLLALALPYSQHPDYRQEWKP